MRDGRDMWQKGWLTCMPGPATSARSYSSASQPSRASCSIFSTAPAKAIPQFLILPPEMLKEAFHMMQSVVMPAVMAHTIRPLSEQSCFQIECIISDNLHGKGSSSCHGEDH